MKARTALCGLGTAVPRHLGSLEDSLRFMSRVHRENERVVSFLKKIHESSGIETRHSVIPDFLSDDPERFVFFPKNWKLEPFPTTKERMKLYEAESVKLATEASEKAMRQAAVKPEEITHLVVSTCTGFFAPGPDILLARRLGLRSTVNRTLIGFMGCYAGFNGMRTADQIVHQHPDAVVLQICVELCTIHFQKDASTEYLISNVLFSDGCSAAVYAHGNRATHALAYIAGNLCMVDGDSLNDMQWHIGDHGFEMKLSISVPKTLKARAGEFVGSLLAKTRVSSREITRWAIHPGGKKIVEGIQEALSLREEQVSTALDVLRRFGNMSSPTIFFVLKEELKKGKGPMVCLGFGPGLTIEGAVLVSG